MTSLGTSARFVRIWRCRSTREKADAYERYLLAKGIDPLIGKGALAFHMRRDDGEGRDSLRRANDSCEPPVHHEGPCYWPPHGITLGVPSSRGRARARRSWRVLQIVSSAPVPPGS